MTALSSYSLGTVTVAANGTTVTGSGVIWSDANAFPGDILQIGNFQTVITDKTDTSHLVIPPWGGGAQAGALYVIWKVSPLRFAGATAMASVNQLVADLNTDALEWILPASLADPTGYVAQDNQFIRQPATGKVWFMQGGAWVYLGIQKGFGVPAPYDNAHTYNTMDVATSGGSSYVYINVASSAGNAPPNAAYWTVLASIGATGATGATGAAGANAPTYGGTSTTSLVIGTERWLRKFGQ